MKVLVIQQRPGIGDLVIFLSFIRKIVSKFNSPVFKIRGRENKC